jgi:hypothetical protein
VFNDSVLVVVIVEREEEGLVVLEEAVVWGWLATMLDASSGAG